MHKEIKWDIREYKTAQRKKYKEIRTTMPAEQKAERDRLIFEKLISSKIYSSSSLVLTYVSTPIEVDTHALILRALADSKRVAVPKCIDGTREMKFYLIRSMQDLEKATFSVLEPKTDICEELTKYDIQDTLCIVPGLSFDLSGYRLGYGKGYYDRFLFKAKGLRKIGLCYCACTSNRLIKGRFDIPVDILITEKYIKNTNTAKSKGKANGQE